jgi:hypothetical protein
VTEALRQRIGNPLADLGLRQLDRVLDAPERCGTRLEVEQEPGRAWVTIARLADRAGIEQEAPTAQVDLGPLGCETAFESAVLKRDRQRIWLCPTSTSGPSVGSSAAAAASGVST